MAGGALRLARFNTQAATADKRFFQGLPSPAAAAILAGFVWICAEYGIEAASMKYLALVFAIMSGLLMVSNFAYYSFKDIDFKGKVPFMAAIVAMLIVSFIMAQPQNVLFPMALCYAISGPVVTLVMRRRKRRMAKKG
ncbi:MAG: CDP-alcohol phosphatidyltransferase family protein, partial [Gammaproteobacteria bacterium]